MKVTIYGFYKLGRNRWQLVTDTRENQRSIGEAKVGEFIGTAREVEARVAELNQIEALRVRSHEKWMGMA